METEDRTVLVERLDGGIAVCTLNRPDALNAMSAVLVEQLHDAFHELARDRWCRAVVLTGAGRGFCSGHDLGELRDGATDVRHLPNPVAAGLDHQQLFARLVTTMRCLPQPIVAAVNGVAVGGGLALALGADTRVASASAKFGAAFVRVGLSGCDMGVSYLLPRILGTTAAFEMMLSGRMIGADEAAARGLVLRVVPDTDVLDAGVEVARSFAANSPFGVRMTKEVMWANLEAPGLASAIALEDRTQSLCFGTREQREAVAAVMERRPAVFDAAADEAKS